MSFETDFAGMLPDILTYDTVSKDDTGAMTADGSPLTTICYIEEESEMVRTQAGKEVVSTVQVFVGVKSLTVESHVYTLPSRFAVSANREAVAVEHLSDENGAYSEVIMF